MKLNTHCDFLKKVNQEGVTAFFVSRCLQLDGGVLSSTSKNCFSTELSGHSVNFNLELKEFHKKVYGFFRPSFQNKLSVFVDCYEKVSFIYVHRQEEDNEKFLRNIIDQVSKVQNINSFYKEMLLGELGDYLNRVFKVGQTGRLVIGQNFFSGLYHQVAVLLVRDDNGHGVKITDEGVCCMQEFGELQTVERLNTNTFDFVNYKIRNLNFRPY